MIIPTFTIDDIKDKDFLYREVEEESLRIFNGQNNRGQTLDEIKEKTLMGKIAECFLIEYFGYKKADKEYHDVMNNEGEYIEVKAYSYGNIFNDFIMRDLNRYKYATWNHSTWYILFNCVNGIYHHQATIKLKD